MDWLLPGLLVVCGVLGIANRRMMRSYDDVLDGKAALDKDGRPVLGTEAVDRDALARGVNRLRWHQRDFRGGGVEVDRMSFYPRQDKQEVDGGYAERYMSGGVHPVKGEAKDER
jgi:hypothetical protein